MTVRRPSWSLPSRGLDRSARAGTVGPPVVHRSFRAGFARFVGRLRGRHLLVIDFAGIVVAAYLALALRRDDFVSLDGFAQFLPVIAIVLAARLAANVTLGLYSRGWRFASLPDLERILAAVVVGTLAALTTAVVVSTVSPVDWMADLPRGFWLAEAVITTTFLGGVRLTIRAGSDWAPSVTTLAPPDRRATLLYGAGRTGVLMARSARRKPQAGVVPVGFLDDDPTLAGGLVANLRVFGGLEALDRAIAATGAVALLITMPSAPGRPIRAVVDAAMARGLDVRTVPSMNDLLDGTLDAYRVRRVQVEDLLRRTTGTEHAAAVHDVLRDRTVLITGAGGSIGSELARQVFQLKPRRLVLVDRAESALYLIQRELEGKRGRDQSLGDLRAHLANVASQPAMHRLISTEKPDVIFHAAAYKHVPMMEEHPSDAVHVNIGGTLAVLEAADAAGVERFVLVSTDKAVRPSSVMGADKRVVLRCSSPMLPSEAADPYVSVRFGTSSDQAAAWSRSSRSNSRRASP